MFSMNDNLPYGPAIIQTLIFIFIHIDLYLFSSNVISFNERDNKKRNKIKIKLNKTIGKA